MKAKNLIPRFEGAGALLTCLFLAGMGSTVVAGEVPAHLNIATLPDGIRIGLPPSDESNLQTYELDESQDLKSWRFTGHRLRGVSEILLPRPANARPTYYRTRSRQDAAASRLAASEGSEVMGFAPVFEQRLAELGEISVAQFLRASPAPSYLPNHPWDPTQSAFYYDFMADPAVVNAGKTPSDPGYRLDDFRMNDRELSKFRSNGFVVSSQRRAASYADAYYRIWQNDLPVFISCDAILQTWHRSQESIAEELEANLLNPLFKEALEAMHQRLPELQSSLGTDEFVQTSLRDVDLYLTVARSLITGRTIPSVFGQATAVAEVMSQINGLGLSSLQLFGECRTLDFSLLVPRGRYATSPELEGYFKCVMWLGVAEFAVAGGPFVRCQDQTPTEARPRELLDAIVLWDLANNTSAMSRWGQIERICRVLYGVTDSMTLPQLDGMLQADGIRSLADATTEARVRQIQSRILSGQLGLQNIPSYYWLGWKEARFPRVFHLFGQRFAPDSWVMTRVVMDAIKRDKQTLTRRMPSALDVAYAVFGNDSIASLIAAKIQTPTIGQHLGMWQDGRQYQHNLLAARQTVDGVASEAWNESLYTGWLWMLRGLSTPTTGGDYPAAMQTLAWSRFSLNSQLASWTQLRHSSILYVKQSGTLPFLCSYPAAYVEPRPELWDRMQKLSTGLASALDNIVKGGDLPMVTLSQTGPSQVVVPAGLILSNAVSHLRRFADTVAKLAEVSQLELQRNEPGQELKSFLSQLIEQTDSTVFSYALGYIKPYSGWYPKLYYVPFRFQNDNLAALPTSYHETYGAGSSPTIIADVHTDYPSLAPRDPGGVLHQAVGRPLLMYLAVDTPAGKICFAGPVASHFEIDVQGTPTRLTDRQWRYHLSEGMAIPDWDSRRHPIWGADAPPAWTADYLVW